MYPRDQGQQPKPLSNHRRRSYASQIEGNKDLLGKVFLRHLRDQGGVPLGTRVRVQDHLSLPQPLRHAGHEDQPGFPNHLLQDGMADDERRRPKRNHKSFAKYVQRAKPQLQ